MVIDLARRLRRKAFPVKIEREKEIPPQEINFNSGGGTSYEDYARRYKETACLVDLPFLIKHARLTPDSVILDYGCGMGRLSYAVGKYLSDCGAYYGYEPNPVALDFLKSAYADRSNFHFDGRPLHLAEDYVAYERQQKFENTVSATDLDLSFVTRPLDAVWTASVFTHMWVESIIDALRKMNALVKADATFVNSWLMIDDFARYTMKCGLADRRLPYFINRGHTYSQKNPLVCVAYDEEAVREVYAAAGHQIVEIVSGNWSGRTSPHHQDMIVSRLL